MLLPCFNVRNGNVEVRAPLRMPKRDIDKFVTSKAKMNHSEKFWAIAADKLPDYKSRQKHLRELQQKLRTEDWEV